MSITDHGIFVSLMLCIEKNITKVFRLFICRVPISLNLTYV